MTDNFYENLLLACYIWVGLGAWLFRRGTARFWSMVLITAGVVFIAVVSGEYVRLVLALHENA